MSLLLLLLRFSTSTTIIINIIICIIAIIIVIIIIIIITVRSRRRLLLALVVIRHGYPQVTMSDATEAKSTEKDRGDWDFSRTKIITVHPLVKFVHERRMLRSV